MKKKIVHPFRRKEVTLPWRYLLLFLLLFAFFSHAQLRRNNQNTPGKPSLVQAGKVNEVPEAASIHAGSQDERSPLEEMRGKPEELSKRDAFAKHFKNADGSYTAVIGSGPIHYKKDGRWEDIDTKVQKDSYGGYGYSNKANLMESYFGATSSKGIMSKTKEGEIREFLNTRMYWEVNGAEVQPVTSADVAARIEGDKVYYDHLFGKISAEFTVKSGQRKLNYIIPDKNSLGEIVHNAEYLVFAEEFEISENFKIVEGLQQYNKLKKEYEKISGIFVVDRKGQVIYSYSAPAIIEGYNPNVIGLPARMNPEISFSQEGNSVTFYTKVKVSWLNSESRVYPIAIDPTVSAYPFNTNFSSGQTYSTGGGSGNMAAGYSGGWYRGWATFNLTSLPSLSGVTDARISLYINSKGGTHGSNGTSNINIGHTAFDLSRLIWVNNYTTLYNAITASTNSTGAYNYIPNVNAGAYTTVDLKPGSNTLALDEIEKKSGNDTAFFAVSFSPSWGTGTTQRYYVIAGYTEVNKPYLTITYTAEDKYKHAAYQYANAAAIGDVGYVQIGNVNIGSINNTTAITNYASNASVIFRNTPTGYNKYNLSTDVTPGNSYALKVTYRDLGSPYNSGKIAAWVDWNDDGDFADADEFIGISPNATSGNQILNFTVSVPSSTNSGPKRLRIRSVLWDDQLNDSDYDKTFEYGETEDYTLNVLVTCTTVGWANLHNPQNGNLCLGSPFTAYGQIYIAGVTEAAGAGAGIEAQFGYSTSDSNPSGAGWTWQNASFSSQQGNNDEFKYDFTPSVAGTYYYTFRYRSGPTCPWSYGGYHSGGGGFWDDTVNVSGLLTVDVAAVAGTAASAVTGSICKGNSVTLSLEDYTGNVHWQSSSDGVAFTDIAGAESAGYTTENLLSKTFFRARVKSGACEDQYSNVLSFDIDLPASFANLQWPGSASSCANMLYTVYGRVFIGGKTDQAAQSSGLSAEFGWSTVNSHPESWVNWQPALYNGKVDAGDGQLHNEEYKFDFMPPSSGTYYYTFRYKNGTCDYVYGGFANDSNVNHGGIWDGILHRSGELIVGQNTVWNGSSWSIVPGSADYLSAEIQGNYSTSGAGLNVCALSVTNHSVLNIKAGSPVTVRNQIKVDPGSDIVVESDANLIQINDDPNPENSGSITVKRNINVSSDRKQYNFLISPVVGANLKTNIYRDGSGNPVSSPSVQYYIESTNYFGESSGAYIAGRGLAVKEPLTGNGPFYAVFAGPPANGEISINAVNSAPGVTTPGTTMRGHNLIGNPYPSNLDLLTFYNTNGGEAGNLNSTFRFWDNYKNTTYSQMGSNYSGNSYASYNVKSATGTAATSDAGASGASKKIPGRYVKVGQGFFARIVGVPSKTLKFYNNSRSKEFEDDAFFGRGGSAMDRYWLKMVTPGQLAVQMAVVYFGGGSNGFGPDDSFSSGGSDELYSVTDGLKIGINGRSPFAVSDRVPLGSRHYESGSYTIAIDQAEGIFANGQNIYLKDNQTGTVANLSEGSYNFSAGAGETTGRFEIIYEPQTILATDGKVKENLQVYRDGTDFVVKASDTKITMIEVFDGAGRLILNLRPNSTKAVIDGNPLSNGMYLLKIHHGEQVTTRKILK